MTCFDEPFHMRNEPAAAGELTLYDGLTAESYDLWLADEDFGDVALFRRLVAAAPGQALELACGTGRLLIPFLAEGLAVEGLDNAADMLAICRRKAAMRGLDPVLHQGDMTDFDLGRLFGLVYCAVGSFTLLAAPGSMARTLRAIRRHLLPGGQVAIAMDRPPALEAVGTVRLAREARHPEDGTLRRCWLAVEAPRWPETRRFTMTSEALAADGSVLRQETRPLETRPMQPEAFAALLAQAGFGPTEIMIPESTNPAIVAASYVAVAGCSERAGT